VVNITNFGVFVDIGLKQNGFVHKSEVTDNVPAHVDVVPTHFVRVGDQVKVKVLAVEPEKDRVTLSIRQSKREGPPELREAKGSKKTDVRWLELNLV